MSNSALRCYGPGLYGWGRHQERWSFDFNGHALVTLDGPDQGLVLVVDPVPPTDSELDAIRALGDRHIVVVLNSDHERAAGDVAKALDAPVFAPTQDLGDISVPGVIGYGDDQVLPGGWRVKMLTDLKTAGESVLYHADRRVLVVGDAVVGDPVNGMRLVPALKIPDHQKAIASVATLLDLDFDALLLSDGYCLAQGGKAVVQGFVTRSQA
jgi:glyoxylase-like metal-dependent hydrolase (beta-lactamase superfamily II)